MLAGAPNLHRAVAECTQPYGAPPSAATRVLQVWQKAAGPPGRPALAAAPARPPPKPQAATPTALACGVASGACMARLQCAAPHQAAGGRRPRAMRTVHAPRPAPGSQKYLADERCVDLVYLAVLSRGAAQPIRCARCGAPRSPAASCGVWRRDLLGLHLHTGAAQDMRRAFP